MQPPTETPAGPNSGLPTRPTASQVLVRTLVSKLDWIVFILVMVRVAFLAVSERYPVWVPYLDLPDDSWKLDIIAKAQQGVWLGQRAMFNYGPLFQWLWSRLPLLKGASLGSYYGSLYFFLYASVEPLLFLTVMVLLRKQPAWVRAAYFLLLAVYWVPIMTILIGVKIVLPLAFFAVFLGIIEELSKAFGALCFCGFVIATLLVVAFLLSPEAGTYAVAGMAIAVLASGLKDGLRTIADTALIRLAGFTALFSLAWIFLINAAFFRLTDFTFWSRYSQTLNTYRWTQPIRLPGALLRATIPLLACCLCFFVIAWLRRPNEVSRDRRASLIAMALFGFLTFQSTMVVGEGSHLVLAIFPLMVFSAAALLGAGAPTLPRAQSALALLALVLITAVLSGPHPIFRLGHWWAALNSDEDRPSSCPPGTQFLDETCIFEKDFARYAPVASYLSKHSSAADSILIFPNDDLYGFLARRRVAGLAIQSYLVAGPQMVHDQLDSYERDKPVLAVYSADKIATERREGVSNFVRAPLIWLYLQRFYRDESNPVLGVKIVVRDNDRAQRILQSAKTLPVSAGGYQVGTGRRIEIASFAQSEEDFDFLRLRLRVAYPFWWRFLKPSQMIVHVAYGDGEERKIAAIAEPNHLYDVWIYPWDEAQLMNYFSPDPSIWRSGLRPPVSRVWVEFKPFDFISVLPRTIEVNGMEAVSLELQSVPATRSHSGFIAGSGTMELSSNSHEAH